MLIFSFTNCHNKSSIVGIYTVALTIDHNGDFSSSQYWKNYRKCSPVGKFLISPFTALQKNHQVTILKYTYLNNRANTQTVKKDACVQFINSESLIDKVLPSFISRSTNGLSPFYSQRPYLHPKHCLRFLKYPNNQV